MGNDALAGGESEEESAAPTDDPGYGEVPTAEHVEVLEAAAADTELPEVAPVPAVEKKKGAGGDSEAASRFNKIPEDERYQEEVFTADHVHGLQQTTSDHEMHEILADGAVVRAPAAEKGLDANLEENHTIKLPNDPRYREVLMAEHVEGSETLIAQEHGPRERIDDVAAATEKQLDDGSEDGTIELSNDPRYREVLMTDHAEGFETAKPQKIGPSEKVAVAATQKEQDADSEDKHTIELPTHARFHEMLVAEHAEGFDIETQLVQEGSPPRETFAHAASVLR